jgi:REP element-mobilizing transposase RayT
MNPPRQTILAVHLIWTGYGHWLSNDPRGSGSSELRDPKLDPLGPIHCGRKQAQPPRDELKRFYRRAEPLLDHPTIWFDEAKREAIARAVSDVIAERRYTVWSYAVLPNHQHMLLRAHRDRAEQAWHLIAHRSQDKLREFPDIGPVHPVWSSRPYKVFCHSTQAIRAEIEYIENNPLNSRLPSQEWPFVVAYDGLPCHRR